MKKQVIFKGKDSRYNLSSILKTYTAKKIFIVAGNTSYIESGAKECIDMSLPEGAETECFFIRQENPTIESIQPGLLQFLRFKPDVIIAAGGGSVIDTAKIINLLSRYPGDPEDIIKGSKTIESPGVPLVAIPTTAGSGSEATQFAVVYIDTIKYSVDHQYILPDVAIVDGYFSLKLPAAVTAASGMDAFSQAIESYWSVNSTDESKQYAEQSILLNLENLEDAVHRPAEHNRMGMMLAAHLSGKAINITRTTGPHAVSYPFTALYRVRHGHAVSLLLPEFFVYNYEVGAQDCTDPRGHIYVRDILRKLCSVMNTVDVSMAAAFIKERMKGIGLETDLSKLGIRTREDIEKIAANVDTQCLSNNPRKVTNKWLKEILEKRIHPDRH